ncbi:SLC13 family permease [Acetonema longum]|uniref:Na+/H+ antiporter NhaC n=1 Tax=Acetonema longum DSM 6540 TaxID=1009370 RepID=F7NHE7_9FIRM|nr:SLC13 family permease [Acetonema longum]EGO64494.1 Na+/H+ antiporter NhaC [Acetonema longum DSM 6540]
MILLNPVVISVLVLCILCLLKLDVLLTLLVAAVVGGLAAGMSMSDTMGYLISGMGGSSETALSYILLGIFAAAMEHTGVAAIFAKKIGSMVKGNKTVLVWVLAGVACLSQNLIPVHIAFIPILIPPMLMLMNKLHLDRRAVACALQFGLKAPYITIPAGFGMIYHTIVANNITKNGLAVSNMEIWKVTWLIGTAMLIGLCVAVFWAYSKPREYNMDEDAVRKYEMEQNRETKLNRDHIVTLVGAVSTLGIQLYFGSLPLGALFGLAIMILFGAIKWKDIEKLVMTGMHIMAYIAFIMLVAEGFGNVLSKSGAIDQLVQFAVNVSGGSKLIASTAMVLTGLVIVTGLGTSFGTVPVLSVLYVPICMGMGYSVPATILLIAASAAIGDAGSPVSDTALGPTAGLSVDGQHDHIWDTCVPGFIYFNIPIALTAIIGSVMI